MNVVIAAGGTAGHVNPAVALARALEKDVVTFIGTERGLESSVVPDAGFALDYIDIRGFDRARPAALPAVGLKALSAIAAARRILAERHADVVVGMGGYVSLPVCFAARSRSIPVVVHEQNIVLGLANKVTRPVARAVAVSFQDTLTSAGPRGVLTGNPVAQEIAHLDRGSARAAGYEEFDLDPDRRTILVFGGSLGAKTLNDAAPRLGQRWTNRGDLQVLHISGRSSESQVSGDVTGSYRRISYTKAMALAYAVADVAICRGGATTIAEICAVGLPSIVVPYPHHRDRQQERHGRLLERAGAAVVIADGDATSDRLGETVERLLERSALEAMARAAMDLGRPDAAHHLARVVGGVR
ncbi:MAG: UDP-N-acetylglucosamine--N-acetylmuramyl-(pentapeptide) pyrophosphoryl-undecaprenol [Actinomycetota bacterium]|jgi:UDP-N-acetylglucosamine--N-acetylmuramyl-(pentapeptide) pyrophosphoryl-undecaprenol N-acetylglucosamine transferase|nr:UDP-N-acetylglucosamine--N-acetylmuramyl-(pentapeptide) pyrophosphoryl-undecaprenol [Actinomycetota bacterium]